MPTYQYQCTDCGEALEVHQAFTDDALTVCPACQGRLRKVFNAVGVVFKGSGFYRTDSRATPSSGGEGTKKPADASASSGDGSSKGSSGSSSEGSSGGSSGSPASTSSGASSSSQAASTGGSAA